MKVTKELLEHLKVNSISINNAGKNILCFLERVEKGTWTFSLPKKIDFQKTEEVFFQVKFYEEECYTLSARILDFGEDWCEVKPEIETENARLKAFLTLISDMEAKYESFGRRKEDRIKIGKENARSFGLCKLEQTLFLPGIKLSQPCVVLDASVHGICVITPGTKAISEEENFCLKLDFKKPEQIVILKAHKVYSKLTKTEQKSFLTLSCQLLEPIHFAWKERVIAMIEKRTLKKNL